MYTSRLHADVSKAPCFLLLHLIGHIARHFIGAVILTRQGHPCAGMTLRAVLTMRRIAPLTGQTRAWTRCARPAAICTGMLTAHARSGRRARTPWTPPRTLPSRPSALRACLCHAACSL